MVTAQHEKNILIFPIQTQKISHINNRGTPKELSSSPKQGIDSYEQPKNRGYFQQRSDFMQLNPEISMPYHGADLMTCDPGKIGGSEGCPHRHLSARPGTNEGLCAAGRQSVSIQSEWADRQGHLSAPGKSSSG